MAEPPTIYEWAGGSEAFERWLNRFYDLVEGDELLASLFGGTVGAEHRDHVAAWWIEVMGGPARYGEQLGGYESMLSHHRGLEITPEQRLRFVTLLSQAADDAALPADPEFRAAIVGYAEWGSRLAVHNSAVGRGGRTRADAPLGLGSGASLYRGRRIRLTPPAAWPGSTAGSGSATSGVRATPSAAITNWAERGKRRPGGGGPWWRSARSSRWITSAQAAACSPSLSQASRARAIDSVISPSAMTRPIAVSRWEQTRSIEGSSGPAGPGGGPTSAGSSPAEDALDLTAGDRGDRLRAEAGGEGAAQLQHGGS